LLPGHVSEWPDIPACDTATASSMIHERLLLQ
jgi:hypothetical protein